MDIVVLGSGSKGNCTMYHTPTTTLFIDCGFSHRDIRQRLATVSRHVEHLDAIVITHEHIDHVSGLVSVYKFLKPDLYLPTKTYQALATYIKQAIPTECLKLFDGPFTVGDIALSPFSLSHDASNPVGFLLTHEHKRVVHSADTGHVPRHLFHQLQGADVYVMESNYDPELLLDTDRPFSLKQRIISNHGHLSNEQCALVLRELINEVTHTVIFIHLSQEANTVHHAKNTHQSILQPWQLQCVYSSQDEPTPVVHV
jgi:phosphoribosyl 1,2-cyclic phosphodiesterase